MTAAGAPRPKQPWIGFVVAPIVLVVGALVAIAMVVGSAFSLASMASGSEEIPSGTTRVLTLSSGEYTVFGVGPTKPAARLVDVEIVDRSGDRLPLSWSVGSVSASTDGEFYESIATVHIPTAGDYTIVADGPPGTKASIGRVTLLWFFLLLFGGFAVGGLSFVLAGVILVITLVRRTRRERAWRATTRPPVAPVVLAVAPPPVSPPSPPPPPPN